MKYIMYVRVLLSMGSCNENNESVAPKAKNYLEGIQSGKVIGLDVRTKGEVERNGSDKAINIPIGDLDEKKMAELDKDKKILVFCESGGRASKAKSMLEAHGFKDVVNITDWRAWNKIIKGE